MPWNMTVRIKSKWSIGAVYSPSHTVDVTRQGHSAVLVRMRSDASTEPGPFRLSYLVKRSEMAATLLAYPDAKIGGGYFLLLAGAPARSPASPVCWW